MADTPQTPEQLRAAVREALDNALANGYDPRLAPDADSVAVDLCTYDADLEDEVPAVLLPFVREWLADRR